jgi:S-DNA-T family DNA segregation ATPase FtsK/SpoIIIE
MQAIGIGETNRQEAPGWIAAQIGVLTGIAMLAAIAFVFASLATWNIADPSLSNANGNPVTNAGGFLGSCLADLTIQFAGLASVAALIPPAVWAWLKVVQRPAAAMRTRYAAWLPGVVLFAAALGCLPRIGAWPLPTGLGGVAGDLVLKIPGLALGGYPTGLAALLVGLVTGALSVPLLLFSAGLLRRGQAGDGMAGEEDEDDNGVALGALAHSWLTLRSRLRRRTRAGRAAPIDSRFAALRTLWRKLAGEPVEDLSAAGDMRMEPDFGDAGEDTLRASGEDGGFGEIVHDDEEAGGLPFEEAGAGRDRHSDRPGARRGKGSTAAVATGRRQTTAPRGAAFAACRRKLRTAATRPADRGQAHRRGFVPVFRRA